MTRGRFLTSASKFNIASNGGIFDVSVKNDGASPFETSNKWCPGRTNFDFLAKCRDWCCLKRAGSCLLVTVHDCMIEMPSD